MYSNLPVIEAERLILRPVEPGDYRAVFEYAGDPEAAKYASWDAHKTIRESKVLVDFIRKRYAQNRPSNWAVVLKENKRMIGTCGFLSDFPANKRAEIGFALSRTFWNRGYATEAAKKTIEFGFNDLKLNRIEAFCDEQNRASARVLEKIGMKQEGVFRQYVYSKGSFRNMSAYAILAEEFCRQ